MAGRDYIRCKTCYNKIIYDGHNAGRERLEEVWGDPKANDWTVGLLCPDCIKKLESPCPVCKFDKLKKKNKQ